MLTVHQSSSPIQQPTPIVVVVKNESGISKGIAHAMGPITLRVGLMGVTAGLLVGAMENYPVTGMLIGGALAAGMCGIMTKGFQVAADAAVDATVYAVKLPFRVTYGAISLTCQAVSSVYHYAMSPQKPEGLITADEALASNAKFA